MKIVRFLFLLVALQTAFCFTNALQAQKINPDDVPGDVSQSFTFEYPDGKVTSWSLENNQYVATFKSDGSSGKAYFATDGNWLQSVYTIPKTELPLSITNYVSENYPYYEISVCNLREMPKVNTHYYLEVRYPEVGSKDAPSVLTFDYVGNLINREDPEGFVLRTDEPAKAAISEKANNSGKASNRTSISNADKDAQAQDKSDKADKSKAEKADKKSKKEVEEPFDPWAKYAVKESTVPAVVAKMLKKKVPKPENTKWFLVGETYIAKCTMRGLENDVYISKKGAWKKTQSYILEEKITSVMQKHIADNYKGYKFSKAYKELRADKKNTVYIEFYEKKNWKKKIPSACLFDEKTRKLIRNIDPNFEDPFTDKDLFVNNAPDAVDIESEKAELPESIRSYVSSNYPAYNYKEIETVTDADLGEIYRIEVGGKGPGYVILFFEQNGQFIKKEVKSGMETVKSYGNYDEIEVPEKVINSFKARFPRIESPAWDEDYNENYNVQFIGTRGKEMCIFDPEGNLLEDLFFLDKSKIIPAIDKYISDNYKRAEVTEYYSVKKNNKNYYKVVILPAKENHSKYLWFNANGTFDSIEE